jgi:hypothetical protein
MNICNVNYNGNYKYGIMNGLGTLNFSNGQKFIGELVDGKMHGKGLKLFNLILNYLILFLYFLYYFIRNYNFSRWFFYFLF